LAIASVRPPNPSLIVDLAHLGLAEDNRPKPEVICNTLNERLSKISPPQAILAAVRWTARGNLVVTGAPNTTSHTLQLAVLHISAILIKAFHLPSDNPLLAAQPNVKWSKISINGVPTGVSKKCGVYMHARNHDSLKLNNPMYASLIVMQWPRWVHPPNSYNSGSTSSLSVAFEDPDRSKLRMILAERYLYIHGHRASVHKWKYHQQISKDPAQSAAVPHTTDSVATPDDNNEDDDADVEIQLMPTPPTQQVPTSTPSATHNLCSKNPAQMETCVHAR
jgi:hypothetical protein